MEELGVCITFHDQSELPSLLPVGSTLLHKEGQAVLAQSAQEALTCTQAASFFQQIK